MNEQDLREENERLRREVADLTKSRARLLGWLCQSLNFEADPEVLEKEMKEMLRQPHRDAFDVLRAALPAEMQYLIYGAGNAESKERASASA